MHAPLRVFSTGAALPATRPMAMHLSRHARLIAGLVLLLALALLLPGCALSPTQAGAQQQSQALLAQQLDEVEAALMAAPPGQATVLYIGSAQHSKSQAFERDVLLVQRQLKALQPGLQSIVLSNQPKTAQLNYPFATVDTLRQTFERVAVWSRRHPLKVVLLISTHGNVNLLSSQVGEEYLPPLRPSQLRTWLDELGTTPTVVLLSACYSGSFVPALSAPHRLVMTAAAADRSSFGCSFHSSNTFFIAELFGPRFSADQTWRGTFEAARQGIAAREMRMGMKPPSNPQLNLPPAWSWQTVRSFLGS